MANPPKILITLTTSNPTLSKSHKHDFSITLSATSDSPTTSLIIDSLETFLHPDTRAYDGQGFTFTPVSPSSEQIPVHRTRWHLRTFVPFPYGQPKNFITIPPLGSSEPYVVTHHLKHYPKPLDERVRQTPPDDATRHLLIDLHDQTCGSCV
jgi:hypothetical protein